MTSNRNEAAFSGLSEDEIAVYRFVQGMSVAKKEALALQFLQDMSSETRADLERQILGECARDTSQEKSPSSSPSKNGIFAIAGRIFSKGLATPRSPSSKAPKAA